MDRNPCRTRQHLTRAATVAAAAAAVAALGAPTASASPSGDLWNLANSKHVSAGCAPYADNPALGNTALDIAKTMVNPPGGILGNGRVPTDSMLADRGYFVTVWGEADYINSDSAGSPQAAMDFWLANGTRDIFPNCAMKDMATAVWIQNGKWAAVLLAGSPGGTPPQPPVVH
ncbi:hypothetical protein Mycch_3992 [Mycolicibacterium chubuense NBB4]|uniref:Cysteine-rich secretory protein family protein n=1 Tax=Mycolicibacterium chubuense (strain NBB4) TaxID=710421 RepID=I4BN58_MYCCN|nr:hypothetical protein [Mycolicibacterium chubuense]AFM18715.1 hypothetical protein Mycch_3992 [Mycolicibacterium chubuense NBB4]